MDFFEKVGDTITSKGKEVTGKAKDLAEIANLKSQISTCEDVIRKNYIEIGRLYYERKTGTGSGVRAVLPCHQQREDRH